MVVGWCWMMLLLLLLGCCCCPFWAHMYIYHHVNWPLIRFLFWYCLLRATGMWHVGGWYRHDNDECPPRYVCSSSFSSNWFPLPALHPINHCIIIVKLLDASQKTMHVWSDAFFFHSSKIRNIHFMAEVMYQLRLGVCSQYFQGSIYCKWFARRQPSRVTKHNQELGVYLTIPFVEEEACPFFVIAHRKHLGLRSLW